MIFLCKLSKTVQFCDKACSNLACDFKVTGGKVSKAYLSKKIMEIARTYKLVLHAAQNLIVNKLEFIPEFFEILELTDRCETTVRALQTSLVYQYTNNKQRFEISIFRDKIDQIQKHTSYIHTRIKQLTRIWDINSLLQMAQDPTKIEDIKQKFADRRAIPLQDFVKQQSQPSKDKQKVKLKKESPPEKVAEQQLKYQIKEELSQEEYREITFQPYDSPQPKQKEQVKTKEESVEQKPMVEPVKQKQEELSAIICIDD